ncbi:TIGR04086 family membrane protein [Paenibacillus sp. NEAU-GSW1]|uniref:TIGR04086 family membrane protein n=1 Tax=Paenibacillus sp. NEAU-GSW1 TaxID=2682486 RepID=UPI0012E261FE|nr:TIGR04086 family membrane protein [Paenibacillus sp. NEAU-GSW1]MUT67286.1 TIGR04086 family membrane protein [Paenibacillus sp. NEAU-GSW1]
MNPVKQVPKPPQIGSPVLAGILFALIWLAAGALLLSLLLHFSNMKENNLPNLSLAVHGVSSLAGGFVSGRRSGRKGWYHGGLLGVIYGILILIIGFLAADASLSLRSAALLGIALLAGAFGGMIGVNTKK